jgi:ketosteroid isomerase-like protein
MSPIQVVQSMISAFNAHELDELYALLAEDHSQHINGSFQVQGREACRQADAALFDSFPDYRRATVSLAAQGNQAVLEWRFLGTSTTGKAADCALVSLIRVEDGKIAGSRIYGDLAPLMAAMG